MPRTGSLRPSFPNTGGVVSAAAETASFVAIGGAYGFYVHSTANAWVSVRDNNTADTLTDADAAPIVLDFVYGPFEFVPGVDKYIAVAGRGGTATITITLI